MRMAMTFSLLAVALYLIAGRSVSAQTPPPSYSILVPEMHCPSCAKKIARELYKVSGVAQVMVSVETTTLTLHPKDGFAPSPKGMWEAVERAGYQPTRLQGPSGLFISKPKS